MSASIAFNRAVANFWGTKRDNSDLLNIKPGGSIRVAREGRVHDYDVCEAPFRTSSLSPFNSRFQEPKKGSFTVIKFWKFFHFALKNTLGKAFFRNRNLVNPWHLSLCRLAKTRQCAAIITINTFCIGKCFPGDASVESENLMLPNSVQKPWIDFKLG